MLERQKTPERLFLQLRHKILQIEELSLQLNLTFLVQLEEADAFQEENMSSLRRETYPPRHSGFLTAHFDVEGVEFQLIEKRGEAFQISREDRKSTRLNSSHLVISYAVFCLKKKNQEVLNTHDQRD